MLFVVLPCVVWVKRRDSVRHSTRRQPLLQAACPDLSKLFKKGQQSSVPPPIIGILQMRRLTINLQSINRQNFQTQAALYTLMVVRLGMRRDNI